ncbi:hypothetical protein D0867_14103 [Hortaea werneckii]|nr:hypothetical protein D0867_14103 [Hortaea werneckii]RMY12083.1 hypothetical protein D0866_14260 [Hortaea werneckii]
MMVHTVGYRMQYDQMASHARTRYHFVAKDPTVVAAVPDPSLWIVHYHQTEQHRMLPSQQVPFLPQARQLLGERQWLESQGTIEKREFMLHDRQQWPVIEVPRRGMSAMQGRPMGQPGMYGQGAQQARYPSYYPQQTPHSPQAKRQKMSQSMPGPAADGGHDISIEDEENTMLGDFFDHLTPRDISMTRYMQHHRWMEEVFSSPYASAQIVPMDLGLGLMGELKGLTDGILEPPSLDFGTEAAPGPKPKEPQAFTNLKEEQLVEFNKRVEKHLEEGQAEIKRMKEEHAKKMAEWKKSKSIMDAEKRLRYATWEGHESASPAFRLEELPTANGNADNAAGREKVEDVIKSVENDLGVKIRSHKDASLIEKGGLEKEEQSRKPTTQQEQKPGVSAQQQQSQESQASASNGTLPAPQMYHSDPTAGPTANSGTQPAQNDAMTPGAQPGQQQPQQESLQQQQHQQPPPNTNNASMMQMGDDSMMGGMDMDMNDAPVDFNDTQGMPSAGATPSQTAGMQTPGAAGTPGQASTGQAHHQQQQQQQAPDSQEGTPGMGVGDTSMFQDATFDDFTNMEGPSGDDFVDFGTGGVGEESMFGDALHGMDAPEGQGNGEGQ